jgi:uncharacterized protein YndB with AHSA1/START domain
MSDSIEKRAELNAPVSMVWRALTDHREFGEWFGVKIQQPFEPGKEAIGQITHPGYEHLTWRVVVQRMDPERLFSFTWHPYAIDPEVDFSGEAPTTVEFRLEAIGDRTALILTESGFDEILASRREEAFRMNEEGWTQQMQNIERHLESNRAR